MKTEKQTVQCFITSKTAVHFGVKPTGNYSGHQLVSISDIVVGGNGKLLKSRYTRSNKRFTSKDIRGFDGIVLTTTIYKL